MKIIISENRSGFHIRLMASDREAFDWMLTDFKSWLPKSYRHYDADCGRWFVDKCQHQRLSAWLHQMDNAGATIIEDREEDYSANHRQRERRQSQKTDRRQKSSTDEAYEALHLLPTAPVKLIEAARRILLVECHPDKGGSHEAAVSINRAADELIKQRRNEGSNAACGISLLPAPPNDHHAN